MPPFTNTELISGTKSGGAIKPVEPEDIAAAIVKTLDKPKTHVSVPPPLRFTAQAAQMLPPKGRPGCHRVRPGRLSAQRLIQVAQQILGALQADRDPHHAVAQADRRTTLRAHRPVGGGGRMGDQ